MDEVNEYIWTGKVPENIQNLCMEYSNKAANLEADECCSHGEKSVQFFSSLNDQDSFSLTSSNSSNTTSRPQKKRRKINRNNSKKERNRNNLKKKRNRNNSIDYDEQINPIPWSSWSPIANPISLKSLEMSESLNLTLSSRESDVFKLFNKPSISNEPSIREGSDENNQIFQMAQQVRFKLSCMRVYFFIYSFTSSLGKSILQ